MNDVEHLCGEKVGQSKRRSVYVYKPDPRYVIKVPRKHEKGANKQEFVNGQRVIKAGAGDWIASCRMEHGCIVMERTTPLKDESELPAQMPAILKVDTSVRNWGWLAGRQVKHDYHIIQKDKGCEMVNVPERSRKE